MGTTNSSTKRSHPLRPHSVPDTPPSQTLTSHYKSSPHFAPPSALSVLQHRQCRIVRVDLDVSIVSPASDLRVGFGPGSGSASPLSTGSRNRRHVLRSSSARSMVCRVGMDRIGSARMVQDPMIVGVVDLASASHPSCSLSWKGFCAPSPSDPPKSEWSLIWTLSCDLERAQRSLG
jgi:hypothetical protein